MISILNNLHSKSYWLSVYIITRKSLTEQYRNSFLGMLWSVIQPLINLTVMSFVFSTIWKIPVGVYFTHLFSGLLAWNFMTGAISKSASSIISRRSVFHHTLIPKSMFVIADVLTQLYVFVITFFIIYIVKLFLTNFSMLIILLPLVMLPLLIFTLAVSFVSAYVSAYISDTQHVIGILFMVLFWTVPIMYPIEVVPAAARVFFANNPFYILIHPIQELISNNEVPSVLMYSEAMSIAMLGLLAGYVVFRKLHRNVIYYL